MYAGLPSVWNSTVNAKPWFIVKEEAISFHRKSYREMDLACSLPLATGRKNSATIADRIPSWYECARQVTLTLCVSELSSW